MVINQIGLLVGKFRNRISFGRSTERFFGIMASALVLCAGYITIGLTEKKQALHDVMAGTLVVLK